MTVYVALRSPFSRVTVTDPTSTRSLEASRSTVVENERGTFSQDSARARDVRANSTDNCSTGSVVEGLDPIVRISKLSRCCTVQNCGQRRAER